MHMGDMGFGFLGNTGTVGGTVPTATGAALAAKVRGSNEVVISFFGDGAANQGVVHEAMNLAGVWKLPMIYVCENNQYAMTVSLAKSVAIKHLSERGAAYGFEGKTIDGNDVEAVYDGGEAAAPKHAGAAARRFSNASLTGGTATLAATRARVIAPKRRSSRGSKNVRSSGSKKN